MSKRTPPFQREHTRSILDLKTYLDQNSQKELFFMGKYYEEDDHGSVPLIAEYDVLRFIFDLFSISID